MVLVADARRRPVGASATSFASQRAAAGSEIVGSAITLMLCERTPGSRGSALCAVVGLAQ